MNNFSKRFLSLLMAICMLFSMFPVAKAAETTDADMAITEEAADLVIEQLFGEVEGEASITDTGYEYKVPVEAFAPLTDSIEAAAEEAAVEEVAAEEPAAEEVATEADFEA